MATKNSRRLASPELLHRASVFALGQCVECVGIQQLGESKKFPVAVDAQRGAVCLELDESIEMFPVSKLLFRLVIHKGVELAPDVPLCDVFSVLVIGTHGGHLSPHSDGMSVFYKKHCPGARMALEQDEVSKRYLLADLCRHDKITP